MITVNNVTLSFGKRTLFKDVDLKFTPGNCYGMIGANGSGKSTFLKILSGEIEPQKGNVFFEPGCRLAFLEQNQFKYDANKVIDTVIMGHNRLFELAQKRDELYSKTEFTEEEGNMIAEVEAEYAELNGYESESEASSLLSGLGVDDSLQTKYMRDLEAGEKVKVLLAQALFGNPDVLLLDEPTNNLDIKSITWLENFLSRFDNTVIVVSHDRHFLNQVCTHITDIDFAEIKTYVGNYDFWYQASTLSMKQRKDQNKRNEDKVKELEEFVRRFSANASKARQATSRKKLIDKITIDEIPHTSRRFPFIEFKPDRECGDIILEVEGLTKIIDDVKVLDNFNLTVNKGDKIAFVGTNDIAKTTLFQILEDISQSDSGEYKWGQTITAAFFPKENSKYFQSNYNLVDWLRQYSKDKDETFVRGFLGRMLFSGEESLKSSSVLSGGEKVRCLLSKMMCSGANVLIMDEPTNHLDLESINALNDAVEKYSEVVLFTSQDHQFIQTIANRIVEITPKGVIDRMMSYDEYINDENISQLRIEYNS